MTKIEQATKIANDLHAAGARFEFYTCGSGWFYHPQATNDLLKRPQGAALPFYEAALKYSRTMQYLGVTPATIAA